MKWVIIHLLISYREEAGKMKRSVISMLLAVIFSVCILPVDVWATGQYDEESDYDWYSEDDYESEPPEYNESIRNSIIGKSEYYLGSYYVEININEDNTFDITENIWAYFLYPKHGIYRKIPLRNTLVRLDGSSTTNRAVISDVSTNVTWSSSKNGTYQVIKMGDEDTTVTGFNQYRISYHYNIGKDPCKGYDEFYFNIIGTEWDTSIENVSFRITFPKEFPASTIGFSHGKKGSVDSSDIEYEVNGNVITGKYYGVLEEKEALTIRVKLPDGYFVGAGIKTSPFVYLAIILPVIFAVIGVIIWYVFGRDEKVVEMVEFYPPEGFNSAEIEFLYKGKCTNQGVVSMLLYLANKGYLEISEPGYYHPQGQGSMGMQGDNGFSSASKPGMSGSKDDFIISKKKNYDGNNTGERVFLNGLFKEKDVVTKKDLEDKFYKTVSSIIGIINTKENKRTIFEKSSLGKGFIFAIMIIISMFLIHYPVAEMNGIDVECAVIIIIGLGLTLSINLLFEKGFFSKLIAVVLMGIGFVGVPWIMVVFPAISSDVLYAVAYAIGFICIVILFLVIKFMPKRTPYGNEMLGKIKGFRDFLETAEKEKLEMLVMENPAYFYDILPYTYALDVSDKWVKKFEVIATETPDWYHGAAFNTHHFGTFIQSTMHSAQSSMTSSPGGSGGGSSGGGSGGGGGGSW